MAARQFDQISRSSARQQEVRIQVVTDLIRNSALRFLRCALAILVIASAASAQDSATVLLDRSDDPGLARQVRAAIAADDPDATIADLHVWQVAPGRFAAAVTLVSHRPRAADYYRAGLAGIGGLTHVTVEVNECREPACPETR